MFRVLKISLLLCGGLLSLFIIALYGIYGYIALPKYWGVPFAEWPPIPEMIPDISIIGGLFSIALAIMIAAAVKRSAQKFNPHHGLTIALRWIFIGLCLCFTCFFLGSLLSLKYYLYTVSETHPDLLCLRMDETILSPTDLYILPDSAEACEEFKSYGY